MKTEREIQSIRTVRRLPEGVFGLVAGYVALSIASFLLFSWGYDATRVASLPPSGAASASGSSFLPDMLGVLRLAIPFFLVLLAILKAFRFGETAVAASRVSSEPPGAVHRLADIERYHPAPGAVPADPELLGVNYGLLRRMEWRRFEIVCAEYLRCINYEVRESGFGVREGFDLEVFLPGESDWLCVAKCFATSRPVDVGPLRAFHLSMQKRGVAEGMAFSVCGFTRRAERFSAAHRIFLIGGEALCHQIARFDPRLSAAMVAMATLGNYSTPHCPACGVHLVLRRSSGATPGRKEFWGCINFPLCRVTMPVR
ncbi:MAG: hypothetical protein DWQ08_11380 [Proteobacteria bacterium]|nr:MAG: hypothetical protein DWQ08_11380 [Pseudomonadota bacterium]